MYVWMWVRIKELAGVSLVVFGGKVDECDWLMIDCLIDRLIGLNESETHGWATRVRSVSR